MGINGISEYGNMPFSYKIPEIPAVDYEKVNSAQDAVKAPEAAEVKPQDIALSIEEKNSHVSKPSANVQDLSLSFNLQEDYGYLGKDSNIEDLDVQKAISNMRKDQVLQQYQYFVGDSRKLLQKVSEDGLVFLKL